MTKRENRKPSPADLTAKERRRLRESIEGDDPCMIYDAEQAMAEALAEMESR